MAYPRKPTLGTALDDPMGTSRPGASASPAAPGRPASPALPSYRTEGGFRQTPTPVNPAPRTPMGATPAPTNPSIRTTQGGIRTMGRPAMPTLRGTSALGKAGLVGEAARVGMAGMQGGRGAAAGEAVGAATRLGAAKIGAEALGRLPLPRAAKPVAAVVGGIGGYALGEQGVDAVRDAIPQPVQTAVNAMDVAGDFTPATIGATLGPKVGVMVGQGVPLAQVPGRLAADVQQRMSVQRPTAAAAAPARPDFRNVKSTVTISPGTPAGAAPAAGAPGAAGGGADPNRVLGTFNGRQITQAQADELAGKLPTANSMPAVSGGNYVASTGVRRPTAEGAAELGRVARPVAQAGAPMTDNYYIRQSMEQQRGVMNDIDSQLFALRGRGMSYRSGRDAAAQLLATKAGIANAGLANASGAAGDERNTRANISLQNAQAQNAQTLQDAQIEGQQQIARGNNQTQLAAQALENRRARRPGPITTADGRTGSVDDNGRFQPVVDDQGRPVRVGTGSDRRVGPSPDKIIEAYTAQLEGLQAPGADPARIEEMRQALDASPLGRAYSQMLGADMPPVDGAMKAPDGKWYVADGNGKYSEVLP